MKWRDVMTDDEPTKREIYPTDTDEDAVKREVQLQLDGGALKAEYSKLPDGSWEVRTWW